MLKHSDAVDTTIKSFLADSFLVFSEWLSFWTAFNIFMCCYIRMQRKKGQFTSSKASSDEVGGGASSDWNAAHGSGQDEPEIL